MLTTTAPARRSTTPLPTKATSQPPNGSGATATPTNAAGVVGQFPCMVRRSVSVEILPACNINRQVSKPMVPRMESAGDSTAPENDEDGDSPHREGSAQSRLGAARTRGRRDDGTFTTGIEVKAMQLFHQFDEDGGGSVSVVELDGGLRTMEIKLTEATLAKLVKHYDADNSGELDINEWVSLVRDAVNATQKTKASPGKPQSEIMQKVVAEAAAECIAALKAEDEAAGASIFDNTESLDQVVLEAMERIAFYAFASRGDQRRFQFPDVLSALRPDFRPLYNHPLQGGSEKDRVTACLKKLLELPPERRIEAATLLDQAWCIEELFMRGAPCNTRNQKGYTPLHIAASQNNLHCIEALLNMSPYCDVAPVTDKGYTPHYLAKACKASPAVQLMLMDLDDPDLNSRPATPTPAQKCGNLSDGIPIGAVLWLRLAEGIGKGKACCKLPFVKKVVGSGAPTQEGEPGSGNNEGEPGGGNNDSLASNDNVWFEFEPPGVQDYLAARFLTREIDPSTGDPRSVAELWPGRADELLTSETYATMVHFMAEMVVSGETWFPTRSFKSSGAFPNGVKALKRLRLLSYGVELQSLDVQVDATADPSVASLAPLEAFSELRSLKLRGFAGPLAPLGDFSCLETFDASSCRVTGLEALATCRSLLQLNLSRTDIEGSLEPLASCLLLVELRLAYCQRVDGTLAPLAACSNLQVLNLEGCFCRDVVTYRGASNTTLQGLRGSLAPLASLTSLQVCNLWGCELLAASAAESAGGGALEALSSCPDLRILVLWGCQNLIGSLEPLFACKALTKVDVQRCPGLTGVSDFKSSHPECTTKA